jgi:lipoate-protein ligase B
MNPTTVDQRFRSTALDVFLLGVVEIESLMELQERLRRDIAGRTDTHGAILICEHPPSITIGREGSFADVLIDREELVSRRMEIRWLNRGGGTMVHAPGQLNAYVVVPLNRLEIGLVDFRTALQSSLISTAADLKITALAATKVPGAACRNGQFAFLGAAVRDWVTSGGMHINVSLPQEVLNLTNWGDGDLRVTSLSAQRTRPIALSTARESVIRNLARSLRYDSYHLFTGHPLLHRTTRKVYVYA